MPRCNLCSVLPLIAIVATFSIQAEEGITATEIKLGQCAALEGPASGLGVNMRLGLNAYFDALNKKGGVHGRSIKLVSVDDGYEPEKTVDGTLKLIEEEKVFALVGYVGTPTSKVAVPIVEEKRVPLVGLFTGAMLLREPVQRHVINIRASYNDETEALVERLTKDLGVQRIAVFYQDDSFGLAGLDGTKRALEKRKMALAGTGKFARNTVAVKAGLSAVMEAKPDAVVMVGPYKPVAAFIKEAKAQSFAPIFATISFVGTENLLKELGADAEGIVISQVVPSPDDESVPIVKAFRESLAAGAPDAAPNYVALEGFITAKVFHQALETLGATPTRAGLLDVLEGMRNVDVGGLSVSFSKTSHQGLDAVFITRVEGGRAKARQALK